MSGANPYTADWLSALRAGWRWWRGEVAAMIPAGIRSRLERGVSIVAIDLESETVVLRRFEDGDESEIGRIAYADFNATSLRAALSDRLSRSWFLRDSFALRLPDAAALRRDLPLPLAAQGNIASLLDLELERQSPLDRSEIYHDYRVLRIDRQARRIDVVWRMVRRESIAPALEVCRQAGIDLAVIAFIGDETPADGGNFPVEARAALLLRLRRWLVRGLLMLILVLLMAIAAGIYSRNQAAADEFSARLDAARIAARPSLHLQHEIDAARTRSALLLKEKQRLSVTRMLAETTRLLPNGSYLTDFAYHDGEVRIRGYSNAASSLIGLFDASPLFSAAEFRAPLVQAQGPDQEQFDLAFKIRKGAR